MADEAIGCDLESPARSRSGGSVHPSQDRDCTDLASHSAVNRSRSYDCATAFKSETAAAALSRRFESGTGLHFAVPAGRRHPDTTSCQSCLAIGRRCTTGSIARSVMAIGDVHGWRVSPVTASLTCAEILIRLVETDPLRGLLRGIPP